MTITGGQAEGQSGGETTAPKKDLMGGLRLALEQGQLKVAAKAEWSGVLRAELAGMRVKTKGGGGERMEGEEHDDLTVALALGVWACRKRLGAKMAGATGWCVREGADY